MLRVLADQHSRRKSVYFHIAVEPGYRLTLFPTASPPSMALISTSLSTSDQHDSLFFKLLPPELRNNIYKLAFSPATNEDGSISLSEDTAPPSKHLITTCQTVYCEARGIYNTAFREYCAHDFVIPYSDDLRPTWFDPLKHSFLLYVTKIRVLYDASSMNDDNPYNVTITFSRENMYSPSWEASASIDGTYYRGPAKDYWNRWTLEERARSALRHWILTRTSQNTVECRSIPCHETFPFSIDFVVAQAIGGESVYTIDSDETRRINLSLESRQIFDAKHGKEVR